MVKGGYRSRFTENKAARSQFTKNTTLAFHASRKIKEKVLENHGSRRLWKSRFTRNKLAISHFTGKKRADHESRKYPLPPSSDLIKKNSVLTSRLLSIVIFTLYHIKESFSYSSAISAYAANHFKFLMMYVEAYETLSSQIKIFTTCVVLFSYVCDRSLFFNF